jgi:hypothetical protein
MQIGMSRAKFAMMSVAIHVGFSLGDAAMAGQNVGMGGGIVTGKCNPASEEPQQPMLLDFWESTYRRQLPPSLGDDHASVKDHIELALKRLERLDAKRADLYRKWADEYEGEVLEVDPRIELPPLADLGDIQPALPFGCKVERVVEQTTPETMFDKRYNVRIDLFNKLDALNQAGLILHEIIYRDGIARGHKTSRNARYFLGVISSKVVLKMTQKEYDQLVTILGFNSYSNYSSNYMALSFFDGGAASREEAIAICDSLKGTSYLGVFCTSAAREQIFKEILGTAFWNLLFDQEDPKFQFWSLVSDNSNDELVCEGFKGYNKPESGKKIPFFCVQEVKYSPVYF